jgi:death-on-curing protein
MTPLIHYLTPGEIYAAAEAATGEPAVARDPHLIRSAAARPLLRAFGTEAYPTLLEKAAALMHAVAAHHPFWDGNKRAATRVTEVFLDKNGLKPTWTPAEVYTFVLHIAQNQHDVPAIAAWLAAHTAPKVRYPTIDELVYINEQLVGGSNLHTIVEGKRKVRDMGLLEAAAARPVASVFGADAYPTLQAKAAALLHALSRNHPFADGNKRTAAIAFLFLLAVNGWRVTWQPAEALDWIVRVAEGKAEPEAFAAWLPLAPRPGQQLEPDLHADTQLIHDLLRAHEWLIHELAQR